MLAHLHINRGARPLGRPTGLRHRTSPICPVQQMLPRSWRPSAWALISMRMIHSSTAATWLRMRKHYRDWSSVPLRLWMASNRLRLNPDKTQFIWFGMRQQLAKPNCDRLSGVANSNVWHTRPEPRGVILDSEWLIRDHSYVVPVFPAASSACDSPLSHAEIDFHARTKLYLQQDRLL